MYTSLLVAIACAILLYRAAEYEKISPWLWVLLSGGLSGIILMLSPRIAVLLVAQVGLFLAMWVYNIRRRTPHRDSSH